MNPNRALLSLSVAEIAIPDQRIGYFDEAHAKRLGADILANGQHDPIHVKRNGNAAKLPWTLIAGLHRLDGVQKVGLSTIDAIQVAEPGASATELRRLELSENLDHRQRRPIERAIFMVERARLEEEIDHPGRVGEPSQARAGRARQAASDTMSLAEGWRARTAAAMDCSVKQLERYQRLHRNIVAEGSGLSDLAEALNFHRLGASFSAMNRLATINDEARRSLAQAILDHPDWETMDEALKTTGLKLSTGNRLDKDRPDAVLLDAWASATTEVRLAHVQWLAKKVNARQAKAIIAGFKERGLL